MKALQCEMCGSQDMVKQDGMYVCQNCGTKYSVEEARKMMIQGTDNIYSVNEVSYENILERAKTSFDEKRFDLAYNYYDQAVEMKQDIAEDVLRLGLSYLAKENYCSEVPEFTINRTTKAIKILKEMPEGEEKNEVVLSAIDDMNLVVKFVDKQKYAEIKDLNLEKKETRSAGEAIIDFIATPMLIDEMKRIDDRKARKYNEVISKKIDYVNDRFSALNDFLWKYRKEIIDCADINTRFKQYCKYNMFDEATEVFSQITLSYTEQKKLTENLLDTAIMIEDVKAVKMLLRMGASLYDEDGESVLNTAAFINNMEIFKLLLDAGAKPDVLTLNTAISVKNIEMFNMLLDAGVKPDDSTATIIVNDYEAGKFKKILIEKDPSFMDKLNLVPPDERIGGCYVATAVYGSYDCPEVWTLRRFRDFTLAKSVFGRLFICTYYAISPTLVKWFGETKWFKNLWKPTLDKMVARLNEKGVENTPYDDIVW